MLCKIKKSITWFCLYSPECAAHIVTEYTHYTAFVYMMAEQIVHKFWVHYVETSMI